MLCRLCRRSVLFELSRSQTRRIATPSTTSNAVPSNPPPSTSNFTQPATLAGSLSNATNPSSLTSTGSFNVTSSQSEIIPEQKRIKLQSSVPGGSELKGLAYLKAKPQIIAREDDQYPDWLWTLLDDGKQADGKIAVDLSTLTKKQRIRHERKQAKLTKDVPQPIPLHEQSKDLTRPEEGAVISLQRRQELTQSSRQARRKSIRESNFLRGM